MAAKKTRQKSPSRRWPLRWDLLLRYRLIEIIALWEGRLTTNHLCDTFGIGRQQASKDINNYLREVAPGNLVLDRHIKGYVPAGKFRPQLTSGTADEYLQLLARNNELSNTFEALALQNANTEMIHVPVRDVLPDVVRPIVTAARQCRRLEVDYVSLSHPDREGRVIVPHTLVHTGLRWHVRAWCEKHREFRDFVLSRFRGTPQPEDDLGASNPGVQDDADWNRKVVIKIKPDPRLHKNQRAVIARDYGMKNQVLGIPSRGALVQYVLKQLQIDDKVIQGKPSAQQIVISNYRDIEPYLFR